MKSEGDVSHSLLFTSPSHIFFVIQIVTFSGLFIYRRKHTFGKSNLHICHVSFEFPTCKSDRVIRKRPIFKKADIDVGVALNACRHLISHAAGVLCYMTVMPRYWPSEHLIIGF